MRTMDRVFSVSFQRNLQGSEANSGIPLSFQAETQNRDFSDLKRGKNAAK